MDVFLGISSSCLVINQWHPPFHPVLIPANALLLTVLYHYLDRRARNFEGVSFGVEHELIDTIVFHLEDIVLNILVSIF
jgi:hypothetical protein